MIGGVTIKGDHMRDYMDRQVTPPKRVISPTWGPPPPCKQALKWRLPLFIYERFKLVNIYHT